MATGSTGSNADPRALLQKRPDPWQFFFLGGIIAPPVIGSGVPETGRQVPGSFSRLCSRRFRACLREFLVLCNSGEKTVRVDLFGTRMSERMGLVGRVTGYPDLGRLQSTVGLCEPNVGTGFPSYDDLLQNRVFFSSRGLSN